MSRICHVTFQICVLRVMLYVAGGLCWSCRIGCEFHLVCINLGGEFIYIYIYVYIYIYMCVCVCSQVGSYVFVLCGKFGVSCVCHIARRV